MEEAATRLVVLLKENALRLMRACVYECNVDANPTNKPNIHIYIYIYVYKYIYIYML